MYNVKGSDRGQLFRSSLEEAAALKRTLPEDAKKAPSGLSAEDWRFWASEAQRPLRCIPSAAGLAAQAGGCRPGVDSHSSKRAATSYRRAAFSKISRSFADFADCAASRESRAACSNRVLRGSSCLRFRVRRVSTGSTIGISDLMPLRRPMGLLYSPL